MTMPSQSSSKTARRFVAARDAAMTALKENARKLSFRAGQFILREGDPGDALYLIEQGSVEISALIGSKERRVFARFGAGEYFGEMSVIDSQVRSASASAETDTVVFVIPRERVWKTFQQSPKLLVAMMREFSLRMREFDRRYLYEVFQQERLTLVGRFAQSIVHDFRSPLSNITFAADLACADAATPEEKAEANANIHKQVDRLANMIGEVLEFTRPSRSPVTIEKTNFRQFVEELIADLRLEAANKSVTIEMKTPPPAVTVPIDRQRLPHVFRNIIGNAVDSMPQGGRIVLRFKSTGSEVITEVEDAGPGIAPDIAGRLFEPFATHGKVLGTGLGLSICKRIVEDHQGTISAHTKRGRGAVFTFSLPRKVKRR